MARQRPINALVAIDRFVNEKWKVIPLKNWTGVKASHARSGGRWVLIPAKDRALTHSEMFGIRTKVRSFGLKSPI